ncbi:hypothetical protein RF11_09520 [Thelohanellus kitauei]|uniref:Uncharacterized protein n=1 Tax=Thelohanellus kitauei TaxID=669202 RepID=A0A0C2N889_THEKT|nr:hypothetical protein RF11_09520 [Thelohanellus kitauei]
MESSHWNWLRDLRRKWMMDILAKINETCLDDASMNYKNFLMKLIYKIVDFAGRVMRIGRPISKISVMKRPSAAALKSFDLSDTDSVIRKGLTFLDGMETRKTLGGFDIQNCGLLFTKECDGMVTYYMCEKSDILTSIAVVRYNT